MDTTTESSDHTDKDGYIKVLEEKNAHLSRLVDIQEAQKNGLKKRVSALQSTISELMEKKAWQIYRTLV